MRDFSFVYKLACIVLFFFLYLSSCAEAEAEDDFSKLVVKSNQKGKFPDHMIWNWYARKSHRENAEEKLDKTSSYPVINNEQWNKLSPNGSDSDIAKIFQGRPITMAGARFATVSQYMENYSVYCAHTSDYEMQKIPYSVITTITDGFGVQVDRYQSGEGEFYARPELIKLFMDISTDVSKNFISMNGLERMQLSSMWVPIIDSEIRAVNAFFRSYSCSSPEMKLLDENFIRIARGQSPVQLGSNQASARFISVEIGSHYHPRKWYAEWEFFGGGEGWEPDVIKMLDMSHGYIKRFATGELKQSTKSDIGLLKITNYSKRKPKTGLYNISVGPLEWAANSWSFWKEHEFKGKDRELKARALAISCHYFDKNMSIGNVYWFQSLPQGVSSSELETRNSPYIGVGPPRSGCPSKPVSDPVRNLK